MIDDLDTLPDWPDAVKTMQREWIGRSHGTEVDFVIEETGEKLPIFTTRVRPSAYGPDAPTMANMPARAFGSYVKPPGP